MKPINSYFRVFAYIVGVMIIISGSVMYLLSLLGPLAAFGLSLPDLVIIVFLITDVFWIAYTIWSQKRLNKVQSGIQQMNETLVRFPDVSLSTLVVSFSGVFLATNLAVNSLSDSYLTYFLTSVLLIISILVILVEIEAKWQLDARNRKKKS